MSFFGKNLKKIRKLKSMSQKDLADLIDLKRGTLGAYEEGRSEPKINTIISVANEFSIPIDNLLKREMTINELLKFNTKLTTDESKLRETFPKIPIISKECKADYIKYCNKKSFIENMPYVEWPVQSNQSEFRAYVVQDLEMSNHKGGLYPDDVLILKQAKLDDFKEQRLALVIYEDIKLRRIELKNEHVSLKADHPAIEDLRLEAKTIKEVWCLEGLYQKHRDIDQHSDLQSQINSLASKLETLEKKN